jgi:replicative superfamily II helicase
VPYKSLANDKYNELVNIFGKDNVGILTGDYKYNTNTKIIVSIYESFKNRITNYRNIKFVVCDEIHTIKERDNIDLTFKLVREYKIQYYAITATFKNLKDYCYDSVYMYVSDNFSIEKKIIKYPRHILNSDIFILHLIKSTDYQILVFKFSINKIRKQIESLIKISDDTDLSVYKSVIDNIEDDLLRKAIQYGIAFYTSDLSNNDKLIVQKLFDKKIIRCILCTDSIATGVNLPCDVIVLTDNKKFNNDKIDYLDENLLIQLYGRAGRKGKSKDAIIYIPDDSPEYFSNPKQQNINFENRFLNKFKRLFRLCSFILT